MAKYINLLAFLVVIGLLGCFVSAETPKGYTDLVITLKDASSDNGIGAMPIEIKLTNTQTKAEILTTRYLSDNESKFSYKLSPGKWDMEIIADNIMTYAFDYFAKETISAEVGESTIDKTFYMTQVGAIEGAVIDKARKIVKNAELKIKCKKDLGIEYPLKTDNFGSFNIDIAPVGKCKISAQSQGIIGEVEAEIKQGQVNTLIVQLEKTVAYSPLNILTYGLIALIALAIVIGGFVAYKKAMEQIKIKRIVKKYKKNPEKESPKEEPKKAGSKEVIEEKQQDTKAAEETKKEIKEPLTETEAKKEINPRARDIMKTLNEREIKIVEFIMSNDNKSTQAGIRNATGIPKTSLSRTFLSLESKKVIKIETVGKLKKIELTDWFMGKE